MLVHLVDGTYELFRFHFGPANRDPRHGAQIGVLRSLLDLLEEGATHVGVATDHVIESFRNELWPGYKDSSGIDPVLLEQFPELEDLLAAAGFVVWPQVVYEADDALGAMAARAAADARVERVFICTPDKDLAQCVDDAGRVVQLDRRRGIVYDRAGVEEKFGVPPASIPDFLALVGDSADGFPGIPGWGARSAATVLSRYGHIPDIPLDPAEWEVSVRGAARLARNLAEHLDEALLFRRIATVDVSAPVSETVDELRWRGPTPRLDEVCDTLGPVARAQAERARALAARRGDGHGS
ncbi:MAG: flap endonuclease [Actinomyces sp.]|nr:MAG: flap endonuclease [Actinomyces sp.]